MQGYCEPFKDKKITVMGLGLLGRGVGDVKFLARCGAEILVTDRKSAAELAASVEELKEFPNVSFKLGGHDANDFTYCDMVLKAAGVPLDSPFIAAARAAHVPVCMSTALFAKYAAKVGAIVVGVTGTRGKSTITHLIHHVLIRAKKKVVVGGNVRGISTLAMLPQIEKGTIAVLELDSWQLQGFGDLSISPHITIFTNLMPDHLNYYKTMDEYFRDKTNIFTFQKQGDVLIAGASVADRIRASHPPLDPIIPDPIPRNWKLRIPGAHNRENAACAASALQALGLSDDEIRSGLESFEPVEGRLQFVREVNGVKIYNDNNATTPEATIAALRALREKYGHAMSILLITGGANKRLDMRKLVAEIRKCKKVILLAGSGTELIRKELPDAPVFETLEYALDAALKTAEPQDILLFSPAFASFGMFKNEYDRGDRFIALVKKLR